MARPVEYQSGEVIGAALDEFWSTGYSRCSVDALLAATSLNRHSLYQSFGGKKGLFRQALERYLTEYSERALALLDAPDGLTALRRYFQYVIDNADVRGCLVANTAVELGEDDRDCQALIEAYYARLQQAFAAAIESGQQARQVRADLPATAVAQLLVHAAQGLSVSARLGTLHRVRVDELLAFLNPN
jgi:TetR/AcrR family transcriptional repressor of nem operon